MLRFVVDLRQAILMQQTDQTLRESFGILKNTRQKHLETFRVRSLLLTLAFFSKTI